MARLFINYVYNDGETLNCIQADKIELSLDGKVILHGWGFGPDPAPQQYMIPGATWDNQLKTEQIVKVWAK